MNEDLRRRFKFFHGRIGGIVGQTAMSAICLARAEARMEADELEIALEPEDYIDLSWDDVPPWNGYTRRKLESGEFECWCVVLKSPDGEYLESLGNVIAPPGDPYWRVVSAELASEHYDHKDRTAATLARGWAIAHYNERVMSALDWWNRQADELDNEKGR